MRNPTSKVWLALIPPLGLLAVVLAVWQLATWWLQIPRILVPSPWQVGRAGIQEFSMLASATWVTAQAAMCGFPLSIILGTVIAFAFSQSRVIRASCYPYAIFLQTVPIIAIAPLIVIWFGTGFQSVVIVATTISLFPVITNGTTGMLAVDPDLYDLFRLHDASRWQLLLKLRLPNSVPHIITGAKTSSGLAVIGAIVGEFFAGYTEEEFGLGYLILQSTGQMKTATLFAVVFASTLLGIVVFSMVSLIGAAVLARWYDLPDTT